MRTGVALQYRPMRNRPGRLRETRAPADVREVRAMTLPNLPNAVPITLIAATLVAACASTLALRMLLAGFQLG